MDLSQHSIIMPDDAMTAGTKRPAKLRRSCESCRNLKAKCVLNEQSSSKCQRCTKDGQKCVFLEPKHRQKRAKNSRILVAEMEEKINELMALVASKQDIPTASISPIESSSGASQPTTSFSIVEANNEALTYQFTPSINISQSNSYGIQQPFPMFPFLNFEDPFQDVISKGLVQFSQVEESIGLFQKAALNFPFVLLPSKISVDTLRRERPFFLLSVLCFGSASDAELQGRLELELRETLSRKVIINGEKSLDLLQGILVYLAWYHFYVDVDREQFYQLSQMAAAMVIDLEINTPAPELRYDYDGVSEFRSHALPQKALSEELERQRTFLGTYFLTSSICQGLRKPNSLKYDDYMEICGKSLSGAGRAATDYLLPYFIQLQRLAEEIDHAFEYTQSPKVFEPNAARIEIFVKAFERQISQIQETFPSFIWKNNCISLRFQHLRSYVNRVAFHAAKPSEQEMNSGTASLRSWYYSASRSECLIRCLQATRDYLDQYLLLKPEDICNFTFPDFILLFYAVLILGAVATEVDDCQTLDIVQIKQTANLDYYINALSNQALRAISLLPPGGNSYMRLLHLLFRKSKLCYMSPRIINLRGADRARFALESIMPMMKSDLMEPFGMTDISNACFEEQWTETLSRWATISSQCLSPTELDNYLT